MGHLGFLKDEYRAYVERLGKGTIGLPEPGRPEAWQAWRTILETLASPHEADFLARMPTTYSTLERLAARYCMTADTLRARLEPLCERGLVMDLVAPETETVLYRLAPPVVGFIEFALMRREGQIPGDPIPKKTMADAFHAYSRGDQAFVLELFGHRTKFGRAMPYEALGDTPPPSVLPWEEASTIVKEATHVGVGHCYCRHRAEHQGKACNAPMENCLVLNQAGEYLIRRNFAREIPKSRALEILAESRQHGLVHVADNVKDKPAYLCNCCGCCCGQLTVISSYGLVGVNPSSVQAKIDRKDCNGCERCARACPVRAIVMRPAVPGPNTKPNMAFPEITERCIGCGVCADRCEKKSIQMVKRAVSPDVPENAIDLAVQMALDRGRLSHLLVDEGAGWGSRFLHRVLTTLEKLPPTRRVIAMHQVKSRFVAALLSRQSQSPESQPRP